MTECTRSSEGTRSRVQMKITGDGVKKRGERKTCLCAANSRECTTRRRRANTRSRTRVRATKGRSGIAANRAFAVRRQRRRRPRLGRLMTESQALALVKRWPPRRHCCVCSQMQRTNRLRSGRIPRRRHCRRTMTRRGADCWRLLTMEARRNPTMTTRRREQKQAVREHRDA
jgi:hypothetical protein